MLTEQVVSLCLEAWFDLGADRQLGYGVVGDIPTGAVRAWAKDEGLDREATRILVRVIRMLDGERNEREASKRRLES